MMQWEGSSGGAQRMSQRRLGRNVMRLRGAAGHPLGCVSGAVLPCVPAQALHLSRNPS